MEPLDLKDLVKAFLAITLVAVTTGQYPKLERFARTQAIHAIRGWHSHPFFPRREGYPRPAKRNSRTVEPIRFVYARSPK
jgi:hypothetical protein